MSLRRSLIWTTIGQIVLFTFQMGSQIFVARHLSPYLVGISAIAFSMGDFVNILQTFGLRNFLVRAQHVPSAIVRTTFTINMIISLLTSALLLVVSVLSRSLYHDTRVGQVLILITPMPIVLGLELIPGALMQRDMHFGTLAFISSAKAVMTAISTILAIIVGASYAAIGWGALVGAITGASLSCILGFRYVRLRPELSEWRQITRFGIHMLGISGVSNAAVKATDLIIGRMLGLAALGLYSRASALNNVLWTNIHTVFTRVVFSTMADEWRTHGSIREIYLKTVNLVTAVLWPAFAGLAIFAGPVTLTLYGEKWLAAAPILSIFAVAAIGLTAVTMTWEVFVVTGQTGRQVKIEMARSICLPISTILGSLFSLRGAATARIVDAIFTMIVYRRPLADLTNTNNGEIFAIYMRNFVLTGVTALPAIVTMAIFGWSPNTPLVWIFASIIASLLLWVSMARLINPHLSKEIRLLIYKRIGFS